MVKLNKVNANRQQTNNIGQVKKPSSQYFLETNVTRFCSWHEIGFATGGSKRGEAKGLYQLHDQTENIIECNLKHATRQSIGYLCHRAVCEIQALFVGCWYSTKELVIKYSKVEWSGVFTRLSQVVHIILFMLWIATMFTLLMWFL